MYKPFAATLALSLSTVALAGDLPSNDEIVQLVTDMAREATMTDECVGLSIAVRVGDEIVLEGAFGLADVEHQIVADRDAMFRIGSITKQFTAAAIMKLVEDGAIDLDAAMTEYLPDYPAGEHTVTVRHLLNHTSGIPSYTGLDEWEPTIPLELTDDELLAYFKDLPFEFEPGTDWKYNNSGYYLLGMIIESASDQAWHEYMHETFFASIGMEHTRVGSNTDIIPNRVQGYEFKGGELANDDLIGMNQPGAAGALIASAGDLIRWQMALVDGRAVSPESYEQMTTVTTLADGSERPYGFGLGLGDRFDRPSVGHGGGINGFNSMIAYFPEDELGIAIISNSQGFSAGRLTTQMARAILGIEDEIVAIPDGMLDRIAGTYASSEFPFEIEFANEDGGLIGTVDGESVDLQHYGKGVFGFVENPEARIHFDLAGDGAVGSFTLKQGGMEMTADRVE